MKKAQKAPHRYRHLFCKNVDRVLKERKIRKSTLARNSGLSNSFISDITTLKANPSIAVMELIAEALEIPLIELLIDHGHQKEAAPVPDGYERVTAILSRHRAFMVRKWEKESQVPQEEPTKVPNKALKTPS